MSRETMCPNCGEQKLRGRLNCLRCGRVYPDIKRRELERDPAKQGSDR